MTLDLGRPVPVLLLGMDHLFGWDGTGSNPDILSPERQAEVEVVVERLAAFRPTKVAVETLAARQDRVDAEFASFLAGDCELGRGEDHQIGFRLARAAGASVHAVDANWTLAHEAVEDYFDRHPDERFTEELSASLMEQIVGGMAVRDNEPLADYLVLVNTPPYVLSNDREYLNRWLPVGLNDNAGGVDLVASWYRRNLRIFANLQLIADADAGDRIVVVIGSAHVVSLRHFVETSGLFEFVDPRPFLRG